MANEAKGSRDTELYGEKFYQAHMGGSYRSATRYVKHLLKIFKPHSVADIGCGRGEWLKAFRENGVEKVVGFDGTWNSQEKMLDQKIRFFPVDLNNPIIHQQEKFDLAISLEVAEHLKEASAKNFVNTLTALSDAVMFSAAYTKQGGTNHINEQPHTYWAKMFIEHGYVPYDLFRPAFWGNPDIEFWYQQNTFLYVKTNSELNQTLKNAGINPISNIGFMDCIHPILYNSKGSRFSGSGIKQVLLKITPKALHPLARKIKKTITRTHLT